MKIIEATFELVDYNAVLRNIERGARVCYKSEDKRGPGSDTAIVEKILTPKHGIKHESVLEHGVITAAFVTDRGVTHELVRHRVASFSQESTRYCNYGKGKFGNEITVIRPCFFRDEGHSYGMWLSACRAAEFAYLELLKCGASAQEARSVLPNSLKTEIQATANVREWRHILTLRTGRDAHPQIRQIMVPFGHVLAQMWPVLFGEFATAAHTHPASQVVQPSEAGSAENNELHRRSGAEEPGSQSRNQDPGLRQGASPISASEDTPLQGDSYVQE